MSRINVLQLTVECWVSESLFTVYCRQMFANYVTRGMYKDRSSSFWELPETGSFQPWWQRGERTGAATACLDWARLLWKENAVRAHAPSLRDVSTPCHWLIPITIVSYGRNFIMLWNLTLRSMNTKTNKFSIQYSLSISCKSRVARWERAIRVLNIKC